MPSCIVERIKRLLSSDVGAPWFERVGVLRVFSLVVIIASSFAISRIQAQQSATQNSPPPETARAPNTVRERQASDAEALALEARSKNIEAWAAMIRALAGNLPIPLAALMI